MENGLYGNVEICKADRLAIVKLENIFALTRARSLSCDVTGDIRFVLDKKDVEIMFNIKTLNEDEYIRIHRLLRVCGISFSFVPKLNLCGFFRIFRMANWEKFQLVCEKEVDNVA